jgi:hypothetical protein
VTTSRGGSTFVVADARDVYFGLAHRHKWERWIDLGTVPLPGSDSLRP